MAGDVLKAVGTLAVLAALAVLLTVATEPASVVDFVQESTEEAAQASVAEKASPFAAMGNKLSNSIASKRTWEKLPESIAHKRNVPRQDYEGQPVSNEFCGGKTNWETKTCSQEYEESMVMTGSPLFLIALFTLLLWLFVFVGRNCCTCCGNHGVGLFGGRFPTKGICYGDLRGPDEGYTECERQLFLFLIIVIAVLVLVGMVVGFTGNAQLSTGVHALLDITGNMPTEMAATVTSIQVEIASLQALAARVNPYLEPSMWNTITSGLEQVKTGATNMQTQVSGSLATVRKYEDERSAYLYWGLVTPMLLSLVAVVGFLCPALLTLLVFPLVALITVVIWIAVGVHVPVAVATADFCVGLDYGLKHPNASSPLDILVGCHGQEGAAKMTTTATYFTGATAQVACQTLNQTLCTMAPVSYPDVHGHTVSFNPVTCPDIQCTASTLKTYLDHTVVRDHQWGCAKLVGGNIETVDCQYDSKNTAKQECLGKYGNTEVNPCVPNQAAAYREVSLRDCNSTCLLNTTKIASMDVVGNYDLGTRFKTVTETQITPLTDCSFIKEKATQLERTLCWDVVDSTDYIMAGLIIIGITFFVGNFIYLSAQKRFHRCYLAERWPAERARLLGEAVQDDPAGQQQPLLPQGQGSQDQV
jgi:hypothetical protein